MYKLVLAILITVALVAFGVINAHEVEVCYLVGEPFEIRLVFLLAIAFAGGGLTAWLRRLSSRAMARRRARPPQVPDDADTPRRVLAARTGRMAR